MTADVQEEASIQWATLTPSERRTPYAVSTGAGPYGNTQATSRGQAVSSALSSSEDKGLIVGSVDCVHWLIRY